MQMGETDATVKMDMSIERAQQIDVALVQPSLSKSFLTKNGMLKIRASTSANDVSILQPNAEYFGCGFVSRTDDTAGIDSQAVWDTAYNFDAAFLCSVNSGDVSTVISIEIMGRLKNKEIYKATKNIEVDKTWIHGS